MNVKKHRKEYRRLVAQWAWQVKQAVRVEQVAARLFEMGGDSNIDLGERYRIMALDHWEKANDIQRESLRYLPA